MIGNLIDGMNGELNLTLTIPPEVAAMAAGTMDQPLPETLSFSLRLVDGFAYINLDDIAGALPPDAGIPPGWMGADLTTVLDMASQQMDKLENSDGMADAGAMEDTMSEFQDPAVLSEFLSIERLADTEVMGQSAAVFLTTFDYGAFLNSDLFASIMEAQMDAMDSTDSSDMGQAMSMMGPMFENMNIQVTETIGLDDHYKHAVNIHFDWDMTDFMMMVEP